MSTADPNFAADPARTARRERRFTRINTADKWFQVIGLAWVPRALGNIGPDSANLARRDPRSGTGVV